MSDSYPGVLLTSSNRRYGHPALVGHLPEPWLPAEPATTSTTAAAAAAASTETELPQAVKDALVVVDLGRGWRKFKRGVRRGFSNATGGGGGGESGSVETDGEGGGNATRGGGVRRGWSTASSEGSEADPSRAWRSASEEPPAGTRDYERRHRGDGEDEDDDDDDDDEHGSRYPTFYPHRQRATNSRFPPRAGTSDTEDEG
ncbi:hypothetical protein JCM11491_006464 [Sporobolomyces phaffii]